VQGIAAPDAVPRVRHALLINRSFALLWTGQAISGLGDMAFNTTLALWIVTGVARGQSWAPLAMSGVLAAAALPDLLVGPFAGVFVDRWDRRRTMMLMDALRTGLIVLLAFLTGIVSLPFLGSVHPSTAWALGSVYLVALLTGSCSQFFNPAKMGILGDLMPAADLPRASGMTQAAGSVTLLIGPPLGTVVFFTVGAGPALTFNALSFAVSWLAIRSIRVPVPMKVRSRNARGFWGELLEGLRFFAGNRTLTTLLVAAVVASLGAGALNTLDIFFLTRNLHAPLRLYGALSAVEGAGLLLGSLLAGTIALRLGVQRTIWLGLLAMGVLFALYSRLTAFAPAAAVIFVLGFPIAAVNSSLVPLVLRVTPDALVGRVFSVLGPALTLAILVSMAVSGYIASSLPANLHTNWLGMRWGAVDTLFTGAGLLLLVSGVYAALRLHDGSSAEATP